MKRRTSAHWTSRLTACLLAVLVWSGTAIPARAAGGHFKDVSASHWAYPYVELAYADGAVSGTDGDPSSGTGVFSPNSHMTYGQLLTMLTSAFYPEELAQVSKEGPWYAPAIRLTVERELSYLEETWLMEHAGTAINRYNTAYILVKILEDRGSRMPDQKQRDAAAAKISDWEQVGADAKAWPYYVSSVVAAGVMSGVDSSGTFSGGGKITRASAAVIYTSLSQRIPRFHVSKGEGWALIPDPAYWAEIEETFYTVYPRLWARWGGGIIQKEVPVYVKEHLGSASMSAQYRAYNDTLQVWERFVDVNVEYKDRSPVTSFAHELGHVVQGYRDVTGKGRWWLECMADYSDFRYRAWTSREDLDGSNLFQAGDREQRDWYFTPYGGQWFFAYMDSRYPTTPQGCGLIDSIHWAMQAGEITSDDISDPNLNAVVKRVTGFDTIEQLHQQYIKELDGGTWAFNGFAGYRDNYITEHLPGVPDPTYPTAEGINLCAGARAYNVSGEASPQYAAGNLVDGDPDTQWRASRKDSAANGKKTHSLGISLGRELTFDTYVLRHGGSQEETARDWRISYYDSEKERWVQFDEVHANTQDVTARAVKPVTAQNLWLEILDPGADGTVRLNELELYYRP